MFKQYRLLVTIFLTLTLLLLSGSTHLILAQDGEESVQVEATSEPTDEAAAEPTDEATAEPTVEATAEPTDEATAEPTDEATAEPTDEATAEPTDEATAEPTDEATAEPTDEATAEPTVEATAEPTIEPTAEITPTVTVTPTVVVTETVNTAEEGISAQLYSGTWQSGIGIKNLTTSDNTIVVEFYNSSTGALQSYSYSGSLGSRAGVELYLPNLTSLSSGSYAARVTASGAVGVSTTNTNYSVNIADSYNGMSSATQFFVPGIYNNFNSWVSELFIQNTTDSAINAYIDVSGTNLVSGAAVGPVTFGPLAIPAHATGSFDTSSTTFDFDGQLGSNFLGSATVRTASNAAIAVVLFNTRVSGTTQVVLSYRGLTTDQDAGTFLAGPVIYKNFNGAWRSGINVQNVTSNSVDATLTVTSQDGSLTATKTQTIAAGKSFEWFLPNVTFDGGVTLPDGFIGSAKVEATGNIVGTATTTNYTRAKTLSTSPAGVGVALGYIMPSRSGGKATLSAPTVYKQFGTGTWNSSLVVSNVGTSAATFSLTFASDPDSPASYNNTISGFSLAAGASKEFYLANPAHLNGTTIPNSFKGSIFVQGNSGDLLAGIVQHTNYGRGVATVYLTPGN